MHKGELHAFALNLYESAKQSLARDGSVLPTKTLLLADDTKMCIVVPWKGSTVPSQMPSQML